MARGADNDNLSSYSARSDSAAIEDWMATIQGNAAVALAPKQQDAETDPDASDLDQISKISFDYPDEPLERSPEVEAPPDEAHGVEPKAGAEQRDVNESLPVSTASTALTTTTRDTTRQQLVPYMVTDALSPGRLGLTFPGRPIPQSARSRSDVGPLRPPFQEGGWTYADGGMRVSPHNAHLFNRPPPTEASADALEQAASQSAEAERRRSLAWITSQPGFLVGLILSTLVGAGYYTYLL